MTSTDEDAWWHYSEQETREGQAERRSWRPVDLGPVLDGTYKPPTATVGARDDGIGLFYRGRAHTVAAESEAGKTWLVIVAAAVELGRGNAVVYIDFEDDEGGVVGRLMGMGVDRDVIGKLFSYHRPEDPIDVIGRSDLDYVFRDLSPTLAVLDGVTEAMTLHSLDPLSNKDAAAFGRMLVRPMAETGAAVVSLDHVTKDTEGRGRYAIGAVHKLNGLNGAAYTLENREPFGIGCTGRSGLYISKDRPGQLRRHAVKSTGGRMWFADLIGHSHDATFMEVSLKPAGDQGDPFRPTVLMRRVCEALQKAERALSTQEVIDRVRGKRAADVRAALAILVDEGYVSLSEGSRGAKLHGLVRMFGSETE